MEIIMCVNQVLARRAAYNSENDISIQISKI